VEIFLPATKASSLKKASVADEPFGMRNTKFVLQKTTLVLSNQHNAWLDEVSADIRRTTGAAISRSALVRAMIAALSDAPQRLSGCDSEQAIRERIVAYLSGGRR